MGKMFNSLLISVLIVIVITLIDGSEILFTPVLNLFFNPSTGAGDIFYTIFSNAMVGIGTVTIIIGTIMGARTDWLVRAGMFTVLESFILGPIVDLWNMIAPKITAYSTCTGAICDSLSTVNPFGAIIAGLIVGPLLLYAIWAGVEYVWKGDS